MDEWPSGLLPAPPSPQSPATKKQQKQTTDVRIELKFQFVTVRDLIQCIILSIEKLQYYKEWLMRFKTMKKTKKNT
jgi:hypothetical protein